MLLWSLAGTRVVSDRSKAQDDSECASVEDVEKNAGKVLGGGCARTDDGLGNAGEAIHS